MICRAWFQSFVVILQSYFFVEKRQLNSETLSKIHYTLCVLTYLIGYRIFVA